MIWNLKKVLGLIGVIACLLLLILVGVRVIAWSVFWLFIIALAGFAWFVLPKMED